jgi:hypothetical protein
MHFRQEQFFRSERVILPFDTSFCFFPRKKTQKAKIYFSNMQRQRKTNAVTVPVGLIKLQHKCSL